MRTALTLAGSDSGGGAGIQADLKTFAAHGVFGMSVVTAITAQNTVAVTAVHGVPPDIVRAQIDAVASDLPVHAVKTGMLGDVPTVRAVADGIAAHGLGPLVVDPVMISKGGHPLLADEAVEAVIELLFPLASLVTPNVHEAERLVGHPVTTLAEAEAAAKALVALGARAALVTGGHLDDHPDQSVDVLFDGQTLRHVSAPRIDTPHTHGTGCTTASALAANLAKGHALPAALDRAKRYVTEAIRRGLPLGGGHGPTHHGWLLDGSGLFPADDLPERPQADATEGRSR